MSVESRRVCLSSPLLATWLFVSMSAHAAEGSKKNESEVNPQGKSGSGKKQQSDSEGSEAGFFFRSSVGVGHGWAHAEETMGQPDLGMQAWAPALALSPGYEVGAGFAVHADVLGSMQFAHKLNPEGSPENYSSTEIGMLSFLLGVGVTYQPLPGTMFVSAGVGFSEIWGSRWQLDEATSEVPLTSTAATYPGYALYGSVGKLWDVHKRWSVGPSLNYNFMSVGRPGEEDLTFTRAHTLWLGLSTSYHPPRSGGALP